MKYRPRYHPDLYNRLVRWAAPDLDEVAAREAREQAEAERPCDPTHHARAEHDDQIPWAARACACLPADTDEAHRSPRDTPGKASCRMDKRELEAATGRSTFDAAGKPLYARQGRAEAAGAGGDPG